MKRAAILASLAGIVLAASVLVLSAGENAAPCDVLIIHAAGTPSETADKFTPENVDAVSCPTPVTLNCKVLADQAAEALRAKGLAVRVAETSEITKRQQLLAPRLVVLASPTYSGTCSWKMHKLMQEPLWQFFALGGKKLDGKKFAFLATARNEGNWKGCIDAMQAAVKSSGGSQGPTMGVALSTTPEQVKERAAKFADEVATLLKEAKAEYPQLTIANDSLRLTLYLPDAEKGYYRGLRFEPSGIVAKAEFDGHTAFGPFRTPHDPTGHDSICGPAEEFDIETPAGYADAKVGETFVKIGVGVLEKAKDAPYTFTGKYKVIERGTWDVTSGKDWVEFRHSLSDGRGFAYAYTKRVSLAAKSFVLAHTLRNTGTKPIDTAVYCHNFIIFDGNPVGPDYRITFPFDLTALRDGKADFRGKELLLPEQVGSVWAKLAGYQQRVEDNQVTVADTRSGAAVKIVGDQPPLEWRFYAEKTAACPEPFVRIQAAPGEEKKWQSTYTFSALPKKEKKP